MKSEYDLSHMRSRQNPYASRLKRSWLARLFTLITAALASLSLWAQSGDTPVAIQPAKSKKSLQIQRTKTSAPEMLKDAYAALLANEEALAKSKLEALLLKDDTQIPALLGLAHIASTQGNTEAAQRYFKEALLLNPKEASALAGSLPFATPDTTLLMSSLHNALSEMPDEPALYFALGNAYLSLARYAEAKTAYEKALFRAPKEGVYAFNVAVANDHLGQTHTAVLYYEKALALWERTPLRPEAQQARDRLFALAP